ncbi:MAG: endonuclease MutS2, partial [Candidatus Thermoplasmatota archaeon]|nr:endonuclease MutS2 [Candidatus Thermoplasmatota archaeon]
HQVEAVVHEAAKDARKRFEQATELNGAPFTDDFPLQLDHRELQLLKRQVERDQALTRFRAAVAVARTVQARREGVSEMVAQAIELDRWQAAARAARDLGMSLPTIGQELEVDGALHLALSGQGDPVSYPVPNGVTLLTGANSGGKTTLLETLGQIAYLAHLGLPVPASQATVPLLDGLAYYARPRQLGAGAFEGFLGTIEDVLLQDDHVLVLADELEAMTELEAAAAIIAEVVTRLKARGCPTVLVTHLAPFILEHVEARVDGIEAKGLDEDNELLVDRTPKVGRVARSTPELILQRLRNTSTGEREALYQAMLARLGDGN